MRNARKGAETLAGVRIAVMVQVRDERHMGERVVDGIKIYLGRNWHELGTDWRRTALLLVSDLASWVEGELFAETRDIRREVACWGSNELRYIGSLDLYSTLLLAAHPALQSLNSPNHLSHAPSQLRLQMWFRSIDTVIDVI